MKKKDFIAIAETFGTPSYVYDAEVLERNIGFFLKHIGPPSILCAAIKANSNTHLLKRLADRGAGADVVSGGELFCALTAGMHPSKIVFSGVGKTASEIELALKSGILSINVESEDELIMIRKLAKRLGKPAAVSFRMNPDIPVDTHPNISTGGKGHKFGLDPVQVLRICASTRKDPSLRVVGLHAHVGSQVFQRAVFEKLKKFFLGQIAHVENRLGYKLELINFGGGFGVDSQNKRPSWLPSWLEELDRFAKASGYRAVVEPGRSIFADAGVLLTRVLARKQGPGRAFLIVDAGMNDFMRTALYDAVHPIKPLKKNKGPSKRFHVVGPVCETTDVFDENARLPASMRCGDLLIIDQVGAYGFSMSSQYNRRGRAAEILWTKNRAQLIRRRETYGDLIEHEKTRTAKK